MDYFNLYKVVLEACDNPSVTDGQELIDIISTHPYILELREKYEDDLIISKIIQILENCIDDNVIKGDCFINMDNNFHRISGLTTSGHLYLKTLSNNSSFSKFKNFAKTTSSKITVDSLGYLLRNYLQ
ncbi:Uncharacterised protein [Staphylococcus aureus]|uniref:hypothetical protein n=1 Tax=Staphylococcus aureus TaxID=1280 RepID=UPI00077C04E4|nr:hypothetical protein [Staphylococcus aureus]CZQ57231.1 Uncharacterised protein [Staphylococcus aureus]